MTSRSSLLLPGLPDIWAARMGEPFAWGCPRQWTDPDAAFDGNIFATCGHHDICNIFVAALLPKLSKKATTVKQGETLRWTQSLCVLCSALH